jgi:hypothetical protein
LFTTTAANLPTHILTPSLYLVYFALVENLKHCRATEKNLQQPEKREMRIYKGFFAKVAFHFSFLLYFVCISFDKNIEGMHV